MKKRILSLILLLAMAIGMVPIMSMPVSAASYDYWLFPLPFGYRNSFTDWQGQCHTYGAVCGTCKRIHYCEPHADNSTFYSNHGYHWGIDITASVGTSVYAAKPGIAYHGYTGTGRGIFIIIDHENGYYSLYQHLSAQSVANGKRVNVGDTIGKVGTSGGVGAHLHFEVLRGAQGNWRSAIASVDNKDKSKIVNTNPANYDTFYGSDSPSYDSLKYNMINHRGNIYYCKDVAEYNAKINIHTYRNLKNDAEHPHKNYMACSDSGCTAKHYTGTNRYVASCPECQALSKSFDYFLFPLDYSRMAQFYDWQGKCDTAGKECDICKIVHVCDHKSGSTGVNISAGKGSNVYAARGGVAYRFNNGTAGNYIVIDHQNGWYSAYKHLDSFVAADKKKVNVGDVIGKVGTTGATGGLSFVEFEVRKGAAGNPNNFSSFSVVNSNPINPDAKGVAYLDAGIDKLSQSLQAHHGNIYYCASVSEYNEKTNTQSDPPAPPAPPDPPAPQDAPFNDISTHWGKKAIEWVYQQGLMTGTSPTTFAPNTTMNRAMAVTILYRAGGEPRVSGANKFSDVPAKAYYTNAVIWASQNGVVKGTSATTFSPNSNVTREQFAVMLYNYTKYCGGNLTASGDLSKFNDANQISSWAKTAMQWAVGHKYLNGKGDGILDPKGTATRAEIATLLKNYLT